MNRREFVGALGAASAGVMAPASFALGKSTGYTRTLVLVELKGGNDGLNTVVPYTDENYHELRPTIAIARDQVLQLDSRTGLHPALEPLMASWRAGELAIVQGVGYPGANLSHFRSIEIWDTASRSSEYLSTGWLTRAFSAAPVPDDYAADGVVVGGAEMGPLAGGSRTIAVTSTERFLEQAQLARPGADAGNAALAHILRVEREVVRAAGRLNAGYPFATPFPSNPFGNAVRTAAQVIAGRHGVAVVKLALNGFDTHGNQLPTHARLLGILAEGLVALRAALIEIGRWRSTLVMTYAEFGRRARQNRSNGTDHGTASAHLLLGGNVKGGLYGAHPQLARLDGNGNLGFTVDFRDLYATILRGWWSVDPARVLHGSFTPLDVLRA
ncbi:MAG: DUF1501 domain-containing protein [Burkholderiales bacterium]|nr:DUF1501 domain-containing protein [Burkholderiales bacterium]